jgi:hypothetical protein
MAGELLVELEGLVHAPGGRVSEGDEDPEALLLVLGTPG